MQEISFIKPGIFFLHKFEKFQNVILANVMLRQSRVQASRASPAQKSQGLRVVLSKNFSGATFFVFWGTQLVDPYLNNLPVEQI